MKKRILRKILLLMLCMTVCCSSLLASVSAAQKMIMGDVDGDSEVTSGDARIVLRASVSLEKLSIQQVLVADADKDNEMVLVGIIGPEPKSPQFVGIQI